MKTTTKRLFQILYTITSFTTMSYTPIKNIKNRDTVTETDQNRKLPRHWHFHNMFCRKEEAHSMSIFSTKEMSEMNFQPENQLQLFPFPTYGGFPCHTLVSADTQTQSRHRNKQQQNSYWFRGMELILPSQVFWSPSLKKQTMQQHSISPDKNGLITPASSHQRFALLPSLFWNIQSAFLIK